MIIDSLLGTDPRTIYINNAVGIRAERLDMNGVGTGGNRDRMFNIGTVVKW